jgi:hypothetical protein
VRVSPIGRNKRPQHKIGEYVRLDQYVESHQAWSFFACKQVIDASLHPWYGSLVACVLCLCH